VRSAVETDLIAKDQFCAITISASSRQSAAGRLIIVSYSNPVMSSSESCAFDNASAQENLSNFNLDAAISRKRPRNERPYHKPASARQLPRHLQWVTPMVTAPTAVVEVSRDAICFVSGSWSKPLKVWLLLP
jgi:hypothetical protein